jgi:polar amino acid transport system substrate-binding protein
MKRIVSASIFLLLFPLFMNISYAKGTKVKEISTSKFETAKKNEYPPDIQKIIDREKIIVGIYYKDKPPFIMTDKNGGLYGLDIALAKDIARRLGVGVVFNRDAKSYTELHEIAASGRTKKGNPVDVIISKFSRTYERAKKVRYTQPYLTFRQALIINKIAAAKNKIEDYPMDFLRKAKVKVGVREKTSYVEYAREMFKNAEIVEGKWENIVDMVINGKITAAIRDEYEIMKLVKRNPELAIKLSIYILKDRKDHIAMAVPCQSVNLLAWLDMYLASRQEILDAKDIIKKYPEAWK